MECSICKQPTNKSCSRCRTKYYCSPLCQKKDYSNHVLDCPPRSADILVKNIYNDKIPTKMAVLYEYGFCNCSSHQDKSMLGGLYAGLIKVIGCNASQLHSWWENGNLSFHIKKAYNDANTDSGYYQWFLKNEHVLQDLHKYKDEKPIESMTASTSGRLTKSVYYLKQYALSESVGLELSVDVDYGFMNCRTEDEVRQLKHMYRKLIKTPQFDPEDLHEACLAGKIFDYVSSILPSNEVLSADLLKNPYPLEDIE